MNARILIVDDEPAIRDMLTFALSNSGYEPLAAEDARAADLLIADQSPDLMLLDWMMPGETGVSFCRRLRSQSTTRDLPIIMLTARDAEADVLAGLDAGADDYLGKPFSTRELLGRVKAVLRRTTPHVVGEVLRVGDLMLDPASHRVTVGDEELAFGPTEYKLLQFFLSHPERVFSRGELIDRVWGQSVYIEERTVDVHIRRLRETLESSGYDKRVQTVRGAGYRFSMKA
ncbi:MAG: phosphate regulon transcriptional regulatory protein PhoB [Gammaproteobacteria bacterium]|nr:MAG: phosphate regulon transcriptional regulatory protein PhoB [Gammaproteobacteria bacterium]